MCYFLVDNTVNNLAHQAVESAAINGGSVSGANVVSLITQDTTSEVALAA